MFLKKIHLELKLEQAERNHLRNKLYLGGELELYIRLIPKSRSAVAPHKALGPRPPRY